MSNATRDVAQQKGDWRALALVGTLVGLVTALCVVLSEIPGGWWRGNGGFGVAGWVATAAMLAVALFAEYWLFLRVFRATGLKLNKRRLEPGPPLPLRRYAVIIATACVVTLASVILFHQAFPILPFRSEVMVVAIAGSSFPLEFADMKANHAYWLEKFKQANAGDAPDSSDGAEA